ncbi:MAG: serine/threonine-protein kinase [Candidatus Obscuribacterales bacterium]|nr:serine/threonine-protein kinase [Candidatus Obscuribacterales bacterium]
MNTPNSQARKKCPRCQKEFPASELKCTADGTLLIDITEDPLIGTTFAEKYQIISILGQGGMSIVYKARHKYMERLVAIKLLHEHLVADELAVQRFQRESRAASSLSHQNIVNVHDFGITASGQAYFVMDCLEGKSLADLLEENEHIEINRAVDIFRQACDGLEHAHKKGIIHRDLKPSNLVLMPQDDGSDLVKIVDFGIAKVLPQQGKTQQQLTQTGEIFGSPLYMSPEQCNGRPMDTRSDIYSLGCLMYETLSGVPPLMGDSFINTVVKHLNEKPPSFTDSAPNLNIPKPLEFVIMKCLAKDADDRYSSAAELRQSILDAALDSGVQGLRPGAVTDPSARNALSKTWERMKLSLSADNGKIAKRTFSFAQKAVAALVLLAIIAASAYVTFWPGPEGDQGTPINKWRWTYLIGKAQEQIRSNNCDEAKKLFLEAKSVTKNFQDGNARLKFTVQQLADVYGRCGMFAEQEKANQELIDLATQETLAELKDTKARLRSLKKSSESGVRSTINQLEAEANTSRVLMTSQRLHARGLYRQEESLLKEAITVFQRLRIHKNEQVAEFKLALADCLKAQQKLPDVRPLLFEALNIREDYADLGSNQSTQNLIKAYLKLGQFDRDQSDLNESKVELEKALSMTRKYFPNDNLLLAECLNSYADLLRQVGQKDEAEKLGKEARALALPDDD